VRAGFLLARGADVGRALDAALVDYRKALELLAGDADLWTNVARVHVLRATDALERERDPAPELARAQQALDEARELNPRLGYAWRYQAGALDVRARERAAKGAATDDDFARAAEAFTQAVALAPRRHEYLLAAGDLQLAWGRWKLGRGEDATPALTRGLEHVGQVLSARPRWARALLLRAGLRLARSEVPGPVDEQQRLRAQAREDAERALAGNPHLARAWKARSPAHAELVAAPSRP